MKKGIRRGREGSKRERERKKREKRKGEDERRESPNTMKDADASSSMGAAHGHLRTRGDLLRSAAGRQPAGGAMSAAWAPLAAPQLDTKWRQRPGMSPVRTQRGNKHPSAAATGKERERRNLKMPISRGPNDWHRCHLSLWHPPTPQIPRDVVDGGPRRHSEVIVHTPGVSAQTKSDKGGESTHGGDDSSTLRRVIVLYYIVLHRVAHCVRDAYAM